MRLAVSSGLEGFWTDNRIEEGEKIKWGRARLWNIWRGHERLGEKKCRKCKFELEKAAHAEKCEEFKRVIDR